MKPLLLALMIFSPAAGPAQGFAQPAPAAEPATEAEFRDAVQQTEQLARGLQIGLKRYRNNLLEALRQQGYGPYHPLFRTSLNGFQQNQIDLEDLDEFKMGQLAFTLQNAGTSLKPDPFTEWMEVQNWLARYETTMDDARSVVARTNIFVAHSRQNIPLEVFQKLRKRWRTAVQQATGAYEHATAVRAVQFEDGAMVPAPANVRFIPGGGQYAVICGFNSCASHPASDRGAVRRIGP